MRQPRPCWHCHHFDRWHIGHFELSADSYAIAVCGRPKSSPTIAEPQHGCAHWERAPGSDDEAHCVDPTGQRYEPSRV